MGSDGGASSASGGNADSKSGGEPTDPWQSDPSWRDKGGASRPHGGRGCPHCSGGWRHGDSWRRDRGRAAHRDSSSFTRTRKPRSSARISCDHSSANSPNNTWNNTHWFW